MMNELFNPKHKVTGGVTVNRQSKTQLKDYQRPSFAKTIPSGAIDELTAIIQPQQVAEDKEVADRVVEFKLSALEKDRKIKGPNKAANFPGKRSKQEEMMYNEIFVRPQQQNLA